MLLWRKALEKHLRNALGDELRVVWTQNSRLMISFKKKEGVPVLRLHESFQTADENLKNDLAYYLSHPRAKVPASVNEFVKSIPENSLQVKPTYKLKTRGENYNLRKIYNKMNAKYFEGKLNGKITWGRKVFSGKASILFGSYSPSQNLTRIHPLLDTELVPLFFLESVIHHEMVHEYIHMFESENKSRTHSPRFYELERKFSHHLLAVAWQKRHLTKLLRYKPPEKI